jgi:hypothetical protein
MSLAEDHVDWWLSSIRQPLIDTFNHGFKHGAQGSVKVPPVHFVDKQDARVWRHENGEGWLSEDGYTKDGFPRATDEEHRG